MDFIGALSGQLGLSPDQAKALAGTMIGGVQGQVQGDAPEAAAEIESAVPELSDWSSLAGQFLNQPKEAPAEGGLGGMLGGLAGAAAGGGMLGDAFEAVAGKEAKQTAQFVALLDTFGIGGDKAAMVAPLAMQFLKDRLPKGSFDKVLQFAPLLSGGAPTSAEDAGGVAGMLGGLLGS